ncbi:LADA_0E13850g1_1 [Lachancea dasiensis]|uniref:LADA_0E13850g1_1 n=1 Tax=Lachancea dasiensis TaxID=1072105 RepID=A0A1G4JG39_9SACH|nr:LADA_0E13850g1_1 [Lachancea dasiensis]
MLRVTSLRSYSALSKRTNKVKVQLLKDFPKFQLYEGQVATVSPSLMRNYLHRGNGARYILKDADIDTQLQAKSVELASSRIMSVSLESKVQPNVLKEENVTVEVAKSEPKTKVEDVKIFKSGVTVKDVKIPGLVI